jgi:predicted transcriptional regulator
MRRDVPAQDRGGEARMASENNADEPQEQTLLRLSADVVAAYVSRNPTQPLGVA